MGVADRDIPVITVNDPNPYNWASYNACADQQTSIYDVDPSVAINSNISAINVSQGTYSVVYTATDKFVLVRNKIQNCCDTTKPVNIKQMQQSVRIFR